MTITIAPPDHEGRDRLKEFLIFRVYEADGHSELSDESAMEGEAVRYADLMAGVESEEGVHYEVRVLFTGALLYSTTDPDEDSDDSSEDDSD